MYWSASTESVWCREKKNTGDGTSAQNVVHPFLLLQMTPAKRAPYGWCMGAIFVQKRWSRASLFFFLEGIPPAWLLWYRLADFIYIHAVTRKPAPTAGKEADLFATKVSLQNWNKLMQPVTVGPASEQVLDSLSAILEMISRAATS